MLQIAQAEEVDRACFGADSVCCPSERSSQMIHPSGHDSSIASWEASRQASVRDGTFERFFFAKPFKYEDHPTLVNGLLFGLEAPPNLQ